jgi:hypothetical protein
MLFKMLCTFSQNAALLFLKGKQRFKKAEQRFPF